MERKNAKKREPVRRQIIENYQENIKVKGWYCQFVTNILMVISSLLAHVNLNAVLAAVFSSQHRQKATSIFENFGGEP